MKKRRLVFWQAKIFAALFLFSAHLTLFSQTNDHEKTGSPYFFVKSSNPGVDKLPLKSTVVDVTISGVIANVTVKQVYCNEGKKPLEAIYVFPASTKAAVYAMQMTIGNRVLLANVYEKTKARKKYEQAKKEGKSASLLEQNRPNVFSMNVANILPGDTIEVEMKYTELIVPENQVYEFVYPTVVGPRYQSHDADDNGLASTDKRWNANPYLKEGEAPTYTFDISTVIKAGFPVKEVRCTSHETEISFENKKAVQCRLKESELHGGNRDYILQYRLSGDKIESGILLYEGDDENFFLTMIEPPQRPKPEDIPKREYIFIVDVSGSMNGFPLDVSKSLLTELIGSLRKKDKFNVLLFAGGSALFAENSVPATKENIDSAINFLNEQQGGGATQLLPAMKRALALKGTENYSRTFIIATDGYVTVEKETFDLIRNNLGTANFFSFGIGSSVNRYIIEGIGRVGMGEAFIATNKSEAKQKAGQCKKYIESPVLTNINVDFGGFEVYDCEPVCNPPDVFAERPVIIFGKWKGKAKGKIKLTGTSGEKDFSTTIDVSGDKSSNSNEALKYLWARHKIQQLSDYNSIRRTEENKTRITEIGLTYNLLTKFTSFVAIDTIVRNKEELEKIKQALPLPKGVSNLAVGKNINGKDADMRSSAAKQRYGGNIQHVIIVEDDIELDAEIVEDEEEVEEESVFMIVEQMPEFPGGEEGLKKVVAETVKYPVKARENDIEGTVYIRFMVDVDGSIKDIEVIRGVSEVLDKEALRVFKEIAKKHKFKPGMQRGKPVKVYYTFPVRFNLK